MVSTFAWASGFAQPAKEDLHAIRMEIEHVFSKGFTPGFARVCLYEVLGWSMLSDFACSLRYFESRVEGLHSATAVVGDGPSWRPMIPAAA